MEKTALRMRVKGRKHTGTSYSSVWESTKINGFDRCVCVHACACACACAHSASLRTLQVNLFVLISRLMETTGRKYARTCTNRLHIDQKVYIVYSDAEDNGLLANGCEANRILATIGCPHTRNKHIKWNWNKNESKLTLCRSRTLGQTSTHKSKRDSKQKQNR